MAGSHNANLLIEAIEPHLSSTEGQRFLEGQETNAKIKSLLEQSNPSARENLSQNILKYMWEEISTDAFQATLRDIFTSNACLSTNHELQAKFSAVLDTPIENEEARQDVKRKLCALLGLITQKADPRRASLAEGIEFQRDVEARFASAPGKYEQFLKVGFGHWRDGRPVEQARDDLLQLLADEGDLLERFERIWPISHTGEEAVRDR